MREKPLFIFPGMQLTETLVQDLRRMNPWWEGLPGKPLPRTRRHLVDALHRRIRHRLAPALAVRGPRQIGKTTAQRQVLDDLLAGGLPPARVLAVQFDEIPALGLEEPILRIVEWYENAILGKTLNQAARDGEPTFLAFDEVQNLQGWASQIKFLVDHAETTILVTGSSALRIEAGRDSLAGRITTIEASALSLTEIARFRGIDLGSPFYEENGLEPLAEKGFWRALRERGMDVRERRDAAFRFFAERGGYPLAHERTEVPWGQVADQLNETVIRRVIQHDLRLGERGRRRDPALLEEVFRIACRYAGQSPGVQIFVREVQRALSANVGGQRVRSYLQFLADSLLLRLVEPLEIRLKRKRGNPKICLADHGLRASWLQEAIPIDPVALASSPELTTLAGHLAESILGAALLTIPGLDVAHLPAREVEPELGFVLGVGSQRIPIEVKYQRRIDPLRDTESLRTFIEKAVNRAPFGLLVTQTDETEIDDPRIVSLPLSSILLLR